MATEIRKSNPEFAKLIDLISGTYQEDGMPKSTLLQLKQADSRLQSVKQSYLEQQLFTEELSESLSTLPPSHQHHSEPTCSSALATRSCDIIAAAELQHCLDIAPETTLLDLQPVHLKHAAEGVKGNRTTRVSKQAVQESLEQRLKEKCFRVAHWHMPMRDVASDSDLQLARLGQLPSLLRQQKVERFQEELKGHEKKRREMMNKKSNVLSEMCGDMKHTLEQYKLVLTARANETSLEHLQVKCQAMLGKLDVMHHQLLKGTCSDGRLQALKEIRSHLLTAQRKLTEEITQTEHVLQSYRSLGEEFEKLGQQYREIREEIENKEWALMELSKTHA